MEEEKREITLFDYLNVFYRYRFLILAVFIITTVSAYIFSSLSPPVYVARSVVKLALKEPKLSVVPEIYLATRTVDPVQSQLEVIRSKALAKKVVMMLGLNVRFLTESFLRMDTVWTTEEVLPGEYTLKFEDHDFWLIDPEERVLGRGRIGEIFEKNGIGFRLVLDEGSPPRIARFIVLNPLGVAGNVAGMFKVKQKGETNLAVIEAWGESPSLVSKAANALAKAYVDFALYGLIEEARATREFLERQVDKVEKELRKAENELKKFKERERIYFMDEAAKALVQRIASLESKLAEAKTNREEAKRRLENLRAQLESEKKTFGEYKVIASSPEVGSNPLVQSLRAKLTTLEMEKARLLEKYTTMHPEVEAVQREIDRVKNELEEAVKNALEVGPSAGDPVFRSIVSGIIESETKMNAEEGKIEALTTLINKYSEELKRMPEKEVKFAELTRRVESLRSTYKMLLSKLEEARIAEAKETGEAKVIDLAQVPIKPVKPKKKMNVILGALLGIFLGLGGSFLLEYVDLSVKTPDEVESLLNVQVMTSIPYIGKGTSIREKLITALDPKGPEAESYRALRTNLKFVGEPMPTLMAITSSTEKEGKTLTASNFALTLAQLGNRVLLVDGDMRNPNIHRIFDIQKSPGLREYLEGKGKFEEIVRNIEGTNLSVIPSGEIPLNPLELIDSEKFDELLKKIKEEFDFIIFDTPPLLPVIDTLEMGTKMDGVLLVVKAGVTERPVLREAKKRLTRSKIRLLGAILNAVEVKKHYGYYYPYDSLYYYGYGKRKERRGIRKWLSSLIVKGAGFFKR
jgi:capsular exopolysaccharide synthesis family protein